MFQTATQIKHQKQKEVERDKMNKMLGMKSESGYLHLKAENKLIEIKR